MKNSKIIALLALGVFTFWSCSDDDNNDVPTSSNLTLNLSGLENLGDDYRYEGWIIVDGAPVSTGTFSVDDNQVLSQTSFEIDAAQLAAATKFVLSIEPHPDSDPSPAPTKILAGDFSNNSADLGTETVAADGFSNIDGKYIVAAPTGTMAEEERYSGIWFLDNSSGMPIAGLTLPELAEGWKYEGWVVIDGVPLSTGTFTDVASSDEGAPFSGENSGPNYPGEDFLRNAPMGLTFPTDVRGRTAVISIEPFPDNSPAPFTLKPLASGIPEDLSGVGSIADNVAASFPTGTVVR